MFEWHDVSKVIDDTIRLPKLEQLNKAWTEYNINRAKHVVDNANMWRKLNNAIIHRRKGKVND